jgi:hypothetical protein
MTIFIRVKFNSDTQHKYLNSLLISSRTEYPDLIRADLFRSVASGLNN